MEKDDDCTAGNGTLIVTPVRATSTARIFCTLKVQTPGIMMCNRSSRWTKILQMDENVEDGRFFCKWTCSSGRRSISMENDADCTAGNGTLIATPARATSTARPVCSFRV